MFRYECGACGREIKRERPWVKGFPVTCKACETRGAKPEEAVKSASPVKPESAAPEPNVRKLRAKTKADLVDFIREEVASGDCRGNGSGSCAAVHPEAPALWCVVCRAREIVVMAAPSKPDADPGSAAVGEGS